jgi:hypothetical protein
VPMCRTCLRLRKARDRTEKDWRTLAYHDMTFSCLTPETLLDAILCALDYNHQAIRALALHVSKCGCDSELASTPQS